MRTSCSCARPPGKPWLRVVSVPRHHPFVGTHYELSDGSLITSNDLARCDLLHTLDVEDDDDDDDDDESPSDVPRGFMADQLDDALRRSNHALWRHFNGRNATGR